MAINSLLSASLPAMIVTDPGERKFLRLVRSLAEADQVRLAKMMHAELEGRSVFATGRTWDLESFRAVADALEGGGI